MSYHPRMTDDCLLDITCLTPERGRDRPPHPDAIHDLAFACWIQSDGNMARTLDLLRERCDETDLPDRATLYRWHHADGWDARMVSLVGTLFPQLLARQSARLLLLTDQAITVYAAALHNTEKVSLVRANVARDVLLLRGLGTAGSRGNLPVIPRTIPDHDPAQERLSPTESLRRLLEDDAKRGRA